MTTSGEEVNFTEDEVPGEGSTFKLSPIDENEQPNSLDKIVEEKRSKSLHEQRFQLAGALLLVVGLLAAGLLAACVFGPNDRLETLQSLASTLFVPLATLLGTSIGWYYASDRKSGTDR